MGLENWMHEQINKIAKNDQEYLMVVAGFLVIATFLYAIVR